MRTFATCALAASLAFVLSAQAPAQDREHVELARDFMVANGAAARVDEMLPNALARMKPALVKGNAKAEKDFDEIAPEVAREFTSARATFVEHVTDLYARTFTKEELRAYIVFFRSPEGKKLSSELPKTAQDIAKFSQTFGMGVVAKISERMTEELRKRGNTL